jgi:Fur family transcriptional regulator, stress-responsive regulator
VAVTVSAESLDSLSLRGAGLRVTAPRRCVLAAVREGDHLGVEGIAIAARRRLGSVSTQAVYDVLYPLADAVVVRRIEPAGSPTRFEGRVGDNHHHLVCRSGGALTDLDCAVGHAPCLEPAGRDGYDVEETEVIYWGQCAACRADWDQPQPGKESPR